MVKGTQTLDTRGQWINKWVSGPISPRYPIGGPGTGEVPTDSGEGSGQGRL